ncbi:hypothetical protein RCH20_000092 [Psychrobacter sp. PL15]|jgi:hypothetical protein|uniref:hypothetical protein n=1 Tax=unclassified Psychrobacter TaxID=196806 RepID=UPI001AE447A2|nr:hypothetical protein [Psychrobacter sp. PL15]MEC5209050.1 hypothetical protein [Psychrobacter sp. PL15]
MKKILTLTTLLATFALAGCATPGSNTNSGSSVGTASGIGMNVFKAAVNNQCRIELEQQSAWRVARTAMTVEQESAIQNRICSCVSEQAPQQVTIVDMTNAAIDSEYRTQLVTKVAVRSLQSCYGSFIKS